MRIHLVNPSDVAFGVAVITPRWLYVLAAATPEQYGSPAIVDESLESMHPEQIQSGDVVGIGIHTANALRGYEIGRLARDRGAFVVFGGIHATLAAVVISLVATVYPAWQASRLDPAEAIRYE